jgi:hypothetical protein
VPFLQIETSNSQVDTSRIRAIVWAFIEIVVKNP